MPQVLPIIYYVVMAVATVGSAIYSKQQSIAMKRKMQKALSSIKDAGNRVELRFDAVSPTQWVYGRSRVAGTLAFANSSGTSGSVDGLYLNMIQLLADHRINAIESVYLNDDYAASGYGYTDSKFYSGSVQYFKSWCKNGAQTAPDASMIERFGFDIDASYKYTDIAYVATSYRYDPNNNVWPTGVPNCSAIVQGKNDIYDPRDGTKKYTDNPSLCIRDVLINLALRGDSGSIDESSFIHAANVCEEKVELATNITKTCYTNTASCNIELEQVEGSTDGLYVGLPVSGSGIPAGSTILFIEDRPGHVKYFSIEREPTVTDHAATLTFGGAIGKEQRYRCWGAFSTDSDVNEILESMLSSCNGTLVYANGKFTLLVGEWREPTITLTQDDLLDGIDLSSNSSQRTVFNSVKSTYISPDDFFRAATSEPYTSATFIAEDNGIQTWTEFDFPFTPSPTMAQRLQKQALYENRFDMAINLQCKFGAYRLNVGDTFYLNYERLGIQNKIFEVLQLETDFEKGIVSISAKETDSSIYDWSTTDETIHVRGKNSTIQDAWIVDPPTNVDVVGGSSELVKLADGTIGVRAKMSWTPPERTAAGYRISYKKSSDTTWSEIGEISSTSQTNYAYIPLTDQGINYDFRIRSRSFLGRYSEWVYVTQLITGKTGAPLPPSNVQVFSYSGSIDLRWNNNLDTDIDYDRTRVWASPINDVNTAVSLIEMSADAYTYIDDEAGQFYFWLQNIDTTGNESTKTGSFTGNTSGIIGQPGTPGVDAYSFTVSRESIFAKVDEKCHLLPSFTLSESMETVVTAYKGTSSLEPVASYLDVAPGKFAISLQNYNYVTVGKTDDDSYEITNVSDTKGDFTIRIYFETQNAYMDKTIQFNGTIDQLPASTPKYKILGKIGNTSAPYPPIESDLSNWLSDPEFVYVNDLQFCMLQACGGTYGNVRTGSVRLYRNDVDIGYDYTAINVPSMAGFKLEAKDTRTGETYDTVYVRDTQTTSDDSRSFDNWSMTIEAQSASYTTQRSWNVKKVGTPNFIYDNGSADNVVGYNEGVQRITITHSPLMGYAYQTSSLHYVKWDNITSRFAVISSSYGANPLMISVTGTDTNVLTFHCTASNGSTFRKQLFATRTEPMDTITILSKVQTVTGSNVSTYNVNEYNATSGYTSASYATEYVRQRYNNGTWSSNQPVTRLGSQWFYNSAPQPIGMGYVDYHFDTASGYFNAIAAVYPTGSNVGISYTDNSPCVTATFNWFGTAQTLSALAVDSGSIGPSGSVGEQGQSGSYYKNLYTRAAKQPATPTGSAPDGWYSYVPDGGSPVWVVTGLFNGVTETLIGNWSTPNRWSGAMTYIESFFPDPATHDLVNNDLLIHTGQFNKIYRYYNGAWLDAQRKVSWEDVNTGSILIADAAVVGTAVINNAAIQDLAVTNTKIATGSIGEANIRDAVITNAKIADATIQSAKIVSLGADKISAGTISSINLATSYIAGNVKVYNIESPEKTFSTTSHVFATGITGSTSTKNEYYITSDNLIFTGWNRGADGFMSSRFGHPSLRMDASANTYIRQTGAGANDWMQFGVAFRTRTNGGAWGAWQISGWVDHYVTGIVDAPSIEVNRQYNYENNLTGDMDIQIGVRFTFWGRTAGTLYTENLQVSARIYNF